jgi:SAM-dependent methyltransferase
MTDKLISDIIQWDIDSWSEALLYWDKNVNWSTVHTGLELGGREGGLSLWLALKGINTVCSDLHEVKNSASPLHQKYNVTGLITYQDIDATNIPYENHFDVIVFKSIIGGIGRHNNVEMQKKTFREIYKALKPGGKLLFAENLTASPIHQQLRKRFVRWGNEWRYVTIEEMKTYMKDFPSLNIKSTGFLSAFGRSETQRRMLSAVDKALLNHVSPANWKYIVYGIAEK